MNFTEHEKSIIEELSNRADDVLYIGDFAPYFIDKSCLEISTYTQTAYIQLGDNMQSALSEYFRLVVFIRKMEENGICYSMPYTALEDNSVIVGNRAFDQNQKHTIADGDLLIQLFKYASRKYLVGPVDSLEKSVVSQVETKLEEDRAHNSTSSTFQKVSIFFFVILLVSMIALAYRTYVDKQDLNLQQEYIISDIERQEKQLHNFRADLKKSEINRILRFDSLANNLTRMETVMNSQDDRLRSIRYWNIKQFKELEKLVKNSMQLEKEK